MCFRFTFQWHDHLANTIPCSPGAKAAYDVLSCYSVCMREYAVRPSLTYLFSYAKGVGTIDTVPQQQQQQKTRLLQTNCLKMAIDTRIWTLQNSHFLHTVELSDPTTRTLF